MIQFVYMSRAVEQFSERQLESLLARSRRNNEALGVSGMLVHHRGEFLQVLEGDEATVEALYSVIGDDPRHAEVHPLARLHISQRSFADWSMGFFNADVRNLAAAPGFSDFFGRSFSRARFLADPSIAAKLLLSFRDGRLRHESLVGTSAE